MAAPTPYNPKYNPFVDPQITALSASPRNPPVTTTLPTTTAPRNIGLGKITKSDKTATSGKYDWLEAGQNFNINNPDPYAEQAAATEAAGGLRNTPFDLSMDQRVAIVDPNFTARQTFYNEETDTPAQSGLNADRTPATLPIKEAKYQTP